MTRDKVLITGGLGFLGTNFCRYLSEKNEVDIVVFDKSEPPANHPFRKIEFVKGDILSKNDVHDVFEKYGPFITVYHLASIMPDKSASPQVTWDTSVTGTVNVVSEAVKKKCKSFVFTSSNVTYGIPPELPVTEETAVRPLEIYGRSKVQAEEELKKFQNQINIQIFRCPVIAGVGRLGLQSILFEFISENKNVYLLGGGSNKYQFVDVLDVCDALEKASYQKGFDIYVIGADEILTLRELYQKIIEFAGSKSKIISLPAAPALLILNFLERLNVSPLGVYQYNMIGRSLYSDTSKIKKKLHWKPKKTNLDTFLENYKWYIKHKNQFKTLGQSDLSSNRSLPKMGIFKLLKLFS